MGVDQAGDWESSWHGLPAPLRFLLPVSHSQSESRGEGLCLTADGLVLGFKCCHNVHIVKGKMMSPHWQFENKRWEGGGQPKKTGPPTEVPINTIDKGEESVPSVHCEE